MNEQPDKDQEDYIFEINNMCDGKWRCEGPKFVWGDEEVPVSRPFYHTHLSSNAGLPGGMGAEKFDRLIKFVDKVVIFRYSPKISA